MTDEPRSDGPADLGSALREFSDTMRGLSDGNLRDLREATASLERSMDSLGRSVDEMNRATDRLSASVDRTDDGLVDIDADAGGPAPAAGD